MDTFQNTTPTVSRLWRVSAVLLIALLLMPYLLHRQPPLPPGVNRYGTLRPTPEAELRLLFDWTARDPSTNARVIQQEIFDAARDMIDDAREFIVADFFLWNTWQGAEPETHRALARELANALVERKRSDPELQILVLSDPINRAYDSRAEPHFHQMAAAGIPVIFTNLNRLPNSNLLYAPPAKLFGGLISRWSPARRLLLRPLWPNLLNREGKPISTIQFGRLLLFKANHRKVLITDGPDGLPRLLVTSLNPADGSSAHSNIGLQASGWVAWDALDQELIHASWSAAHPGQVLQANAEDWRHVKQAIRQHMRGPVSLSEPLPATGPRIAWDSEGGVRRRLITLLNSAGPGDDVMGMSFYLSDRGVVRALRGAAARGARVRLILDPNKDAFGWKKNGIPNRPVAAELIRAADRGGLSLSIRWAATQGEQFHAKALGLVNPSTGRNALICGSANWTRRNLANYNLEANLYLENAPDILAAYADRFETFWFNRDNLLHTVDFAHHAEPRLTNWRKTFMYRIQERFGAGTF